MVLLSMSIATIVSSFPMNPVAFSTYCPCRTVAMTCKSDLVHGQTTLPIFQVLALLSRIECENIRTITLGDLSESSHSFDNFRVAKGNLCFLHRRSVEGIIVTKTYQSCTYT